MGYKFSEGNCCLLQDCDYESFAYWPCFIIPNHRCLNTSPLPDRSFLSLIDGLPAGPLASSVRRIAGFCGSPTWTLVGSHVYFTRSAVYSLQSLTWRIARFCRSLTGSLISFAGRRFARQIAHFFLSPTTCSPCRSLDRSFLSLVRPAPRRIGRFFRLSTASPTARFWDHSADR
jgi:hypothetical protein